MERASGKAAIDGCPEMPVGAVPVSGIIYPRKDRQILGKHPSFGSISSVLDGLCDGLCVGEERPKSVHDIHPL